MRRFPNNRSLFLAVLGAVWLFACTDSEEKRLLEDLSSVEKLIVSLDRAEPINRPILIDELGKLELGSLKVRNMRDTCLNAYNAYFEAAREMKKARAEANKMEAAISQIAGGDTPPSVPTVEEAEALAANARASLDRADTALDLSEGLLLQCSALRETLSKEATKKR